MLRLPCLALALSTAAVTAAPAQAPPGAETPAPHWAFVAPLRPDPPATTSDWPRNAIDRFVLARLHEHGLTPSKVASRETLIRRLYLDLLGLLPPPGAVDRFVADRRPDAYERLVDELLASPHYGERQARHWLDLARYADSSGYSIDAPRIMWPYRDWVIFAFQHDMPFDAFTIKQLAGDLLEKPARADRIATGFHRNTMVNEEGGVDPEEFRIEAVKDRVNTTATVWLGLTVGCAQCHDHKYDPISIDEYYALYAFLNDDVEATLPLEAAAAVPSAASGDAKRNKPPRTLVLRARKMPRDSRLHEAGDFTRRGKRVAPGVPAVLHALPALDRRPTRLDLARWLVAPGNPLTARVTVNRIWQQYFGRGIVATENDFGTRSEPPSHPKLLDWLATELVRSGWRLKPLHRLIVTSATYRQASNRRADLEARDAGNMHLARQSRLRVEAEIVRDLLLSASGLLAPRIGGPSVFPPQPDGVMTLGQQARDWTPSEGEDRYRRGLYTFFWRATPHPALRVFDAPDAMETCTRRNRSNTPLQALTLLNDPAFFELAQGFARRLLHEVPRGVTRRVEHAFRICYSRSPSPEEQAAVLGLLARQRTALASEPDSVRALVGAERAARPEALDLAAWTVVARVLLNTDEMITRG